MMQKIFTEGLRGEPQKETEIGLIPESWGVIELGELSTIIMGQSPKGDTYNREEIGSPLLNGPAEYGKTFPNPVQWTISPTKLAEKDDILFCVRGNTAGRMNKADQQYCIGRGIAAIRGIPNVSYTDYIYYLLEFYNKKIYSIATGGGSTFPNISKSLLNSYLVPKPDLEEQAEILARLKIVDKKIIVTEKKSEKLTVLFNTLINQLMTGQLRVNDIDFSNMELN